MAWVAGCIVLSCLLPLALSDGGYPKEAPSMPMDTGYPKETPSKPFEDGGYAKETPAMQEAGYPKEAPSKPFQDGGAATAPDSYKPSSDAAVYNYGGGYLPGYTGYSYGFPVSTDYVSRYYGPGAVTLVLPDGTLAYTPEVAAARAAHLAALEKAKALWYGKMDDGSYDIYKYGVTSGSGAYPQVTGPYSGVYASSGNPWQVSKAYGVPLATGGDPWQLNKPYSGPLASVTVLPSGYLADTPVIAAARAAHLQTLWAARHAADKWKAQAWSKWD